jgi:hypothetical protein
MKRKPRWYQDAFRFFEKIERNEGYPSVPGGPITLYGTCYALMARYYLGENNQPSIPVREFLLTSQDEESGLIYGPEVRDYYPSPDSQFDATHLRLHSTCTALPVLRQFGLKARHPLSHASQYCHLHTLRGWLGDRDLSNPWFEGNNLLFIGQLLIALRDYEQAEGSDHALSAWFDWLDHNVDGRTGLWGTDRGATLPAAIYGGYHQLLAYYHEDRTINSPGRLVDSVLSIQHVDGGFRPQGRAGACEDVDAVDILVNMYKRYDYRRRSIRNALRRCATHILGTQNGDGGFCYGTGIQQSHMGIPATQAAPNVSTTFPTWFRIHTLALIAEIVPEFIGIEVGTLRFSRHFSMGWHASPRKCQPTVGSGARNGDKLDRLANVGDILILGAKSHSRSAIRKMIKWAR